MREMIIAAMTFKLRAPWGEEPMTASGGNLIGSELNRNKRSVQWTVAPIEVAEV